MHSIRVVLMKQKQIEIIGPRDTEDHEMAYLLEDLSVVAEEELVLWRLESEPFERSIGVPYLSAIEYPSRIHFPSYQSFNVYFRNSREIGERSCAQTGNCDRQNVFLNKIEAFLQRSCQKVARKNLEI